MAHIVPNRVLYSDSFDGICFTSRQLSSLIHTNSGFLSVSFSVSLSLFPPIKASTHVVFLIRTPIPLSTHSKVILISRSENTFH